MIKYDWIGQYLIGQDRIEKWREWGEIGEEGRFERLNS